MKTRVLKELKGTFTNLNNFCYSSFSLLKERLLWSLMSIIRSMSIWSHCSKSKLKHDEQSHKYSRETTSEDFGFKTKGASNCTPQAALKFSLFFFLFFIHVFYCCWELIWLQRAVMWLQMSKLFSNNQTLVMILWRRIFFTPKLEIASITPLRCPAEPCTLINVKLYLSARCCIKPNANLFLY